ncbi:MAG: phage holin family protein [Pontimonas sp.]
MADDQQERAPEPKRSLFALITELPHLLGQLIRAELDLLKAEVLLKLKGTGIGLGLIALAISLLSVVLTLLAVAGILALSTVVPSWAAVLIAAGAVLVVAVVMLAIGATLLSRTKAPVPERTVQSVRQDIARIRGERSATHKRSPRGA